MKVTLISLAFVLMCGCDRAEYAEADGLILCDPESGKGYSVQYRTGVVSKVSASNQAAAICSRYVEAH